MFRAAVKIALIFYKSGGFVGSVAGIQAIVFSLPLSSLCSHFVSALNKKSEGNLTMQMFYFEANMCEGLCWPPCEAGLCWRLCEGRTVLAAV